ncbi:DNA helicase mcm9 [Coemansia interrupta]|uniref:DNA helicase mcm9 n=1 Tax=Coemansia interrupta TaxID=1126814 RepID=A0A9W8H912_9FUNG|nr:DNA helicase mcm9 [Coemansia interrupta]
MDDAAGDAAYGVDQDTLSAMQMFLEDHYTAAIHRLMLATGDADDSDGGDSILVDLHVLIESNHELGQGVLEKPSVYLPGLSRALVLVQQKLAAPGLTVRARAVVRVGNAPNTPLVVRTRVPGSLEAGRLVSFSGTVIRSGAVKMMETHRTFECGTCRGRFRVLAEIEQFGYIPRPTRCMVAGGEEPCRSTAFAPTSPDQSACVDYQEIKVQEQAGRLAMGTIPRAIVVVLEGDIVDRAKSGDAVTVTGTALYRWRAPVAGERPDISLVLRASSIAVHSGDAVAAGAAGAAPGDELLDVFGAFWARHVRSPMHARDQIVSAVCPRVYGLQRVKLAVLLVLLGGVARADAGGLRVRGEAHMLLVGDPGTAKSQFLKFAARLAARAVLTTGVGSTSAGLTVTAVRDGAEWQLEAGALVLADRGVCCIDEFGSIREGDKATVLEAMEQQSISVAKAGIVCKLNARCSVLAAMNPRGRYDPAASLSVNTALSSPLLSRFDLIMVLLDTRNDRWDARVAEYLLEGADLAEGAHAWWSFERLQAYVAFVKARFEPRASGASERVLTRYYQIQRQRDPKSSARTTIRLLESLIRLAQAHARLMFRDTVVLCDAVTAVVLMESTMLTASLLGPVDTLHSQFADDPDKEYKETEALVLSRLGLEGLAE